MSRRVYEVAREQGLTIKEVMGRLNDAGVEAKSNFSVVDDAAYERVFGGGPRGDGPSSNGAASSASNGLPEARQEAEASPRKTTRRPRRRLRKLAHDRSRASRPMVYAVAAILAFAVAAGVGAVAALMLQDNTDLPGRGALQPSEQQGDAQQAREPGGAPRDVGANADRAQQGKADAGQEEAPQQDEAIPRLSEAEYVGRVGAVQSEAVETFIDSHNKLLRYDALTSQDIDEMRANEAALAEMVREANGLAPPQTYEEQHEVFGAAVAEMHEAIRSAYELANDPVAAAEIGFDGYDARVEAVEDLLKRSNGMLGRDYETIGNPQEVSPQLGATEPARASEEAA